MAKPIAITSNPMMHAPGILAFIKRGNGKKSWQREAYAGLGLCPEIVKALMDGNVCCEVDPDDDTVQLLTVTDACHAAQLAYKPEAVTP